jgi:histone acetyltransferase (RNA polymerase elongator complex component)
VASVELGIQSTDDAVLEACMRGHTAEDSSRAAALVKEYGFELIGQMMVGLPCSTLENERMTAEDICRMGADGARIYPTVVFCDTALADMTKSGVYQPLTKETSVLRAANALSVFIAHEVPVIRLGLQSGEILEKTDGVLAGGYHPAVGELAYSKCFRDMLETALLRENTEGRTVIVRVHASDVSKMIGQHGENRNYLMKRFLLKGFRVVSDGNAAKNHPDFSVI